MKRFNPKKSLILPVIAAASMSISSLALANTNANYSPAYNPAPNIKVNVGATNQLLEGVIIQSIRNIGNKMVALGFAGMTAYDSSLYQYDENLLTSMTANSAGATVAQNAPVPGAKMNAFIQTNFETVPNSILSTSEGMLNASKVQDEITSQSNLANQLTLYTPASDTIYSNNPQVIAAQYTNQSDYYIGPPKTNDDDHFNVASITGPSAYTADQLTSANSFMSYLTHSYFNPASALDLSDLQAYINTKNKPSRKYMALYNFIKSTPYQAFQLSMRSDMAARSVGVNNFNHLINERTPSKKAVSGIYDSQGNAISKPSPLQVEAYQANHRINNPQWIQSIQTKSPASVQREIAVELAQVIHQNYQAHLDRERIIVALSTMQLQGISASNLMLRTKAGAVNQEIQALGKDGKYRHASLSNNNPDALKAAPNAAQQAKMNLGTMSGSNGS